MSHTNNKEVERIEEKLVKHLTDRFLGWHLPKDFHPDGGIMFMDAYDNGTEMGGTHEPIGTNLFTAWQAKEMFRFLLEHEDGTPIINELFHQELQKAREEERKKVLWNIGAMIEEADFARKVAKKTGEALPTLEVQAVIKQVQIMLDRYYSELDQPN